MTTPAARLAAADLAKLSVVDIATLLVDVPSVSGQETALADGIETALRRLDHLHVHRDGDTLVAATQLGHPARVILAGHLDTVPIAGSQVPSTRQLREGVDTLVGRGSVDMKGGVAVQLYLAARLRAPRCDVTYVFYDHEEVDSALSGLGRVARHHPEWLAGNFAVLLEPTGAHIEGGCNGTLRVEATVSGQAAHSARAWRGDNAIHRAGEILQRLAAHAPATVEVDTLAYRESLSAVGITGGIATNVIPDSCTVTINYRFAPTKSGQEAVDYVAALLAGTGAQLAVTDLAAGARPGLDQPLAREFVAAVRAAADASGRQVQVGPKYGWTDVARFSALGISAVNYGPGDPMHAHTDTEGCPVADLEACVAGLTTWLTESSA